MYKVGDVVELEIYSELCCDDCGDILHNHLNCLICKDKYASSNIYDALDNYEKEIVCEECGTIYELEEESWWPWTNTKVKIIKIGVARNV